MTKIRIGQSTDIHQLGEDTKLILGGIEINHHLGCIGHSDGDALLHAIAEAILGALALGDLGMLFEDTDPNNKDIDSSLILKKVNEIMLSNNYHIINIDSLIIIEKPKLREYIPLMKSKVATILDIDIDQINIKATRGEKLGYIGKEKGIMAQAVVLIEKL